VLPFRGGATSRNYRIRGAAGVVGFISPVSHGFCGTCSRLRMNAAGRIRPCLFSRTEVDVLGPLRRGADDAELGRLLSLAISAKPEGNYLSGGPESASHVSMSSIGG
jgi:cyclic pyranopterin phosphate synthase